MYWTPRAKDPDGWIYKTQLELLAETGLSRHEQRAAREALKKRGLLRERYERLDHQLYIQVQVEAYNALILSLSDQQTPPKYANINHVRKSDMAMYMNLTSRNQESGHGEIRKPDIANVSEIPENTTERESRSLSHNAEAKPDQEAEWRQRYDALYGRSTNDER
jgi:hypothetical protein